MRIEHPIMMMMYIDKSRSNIMFRKWNKILKDRSARAKSKIEKMFCVRLSEFFRNTVKLNF